MGDSVQHCGPRGGEAGAACEEMLGCLVTCLAGAHRGGTVYEAMIMPMVSKVTTVNANFGKGSNAKFVQDTEIAAFWGNEFKYA